MHFFLSHLYSFFPQFIKQQGSKTITDICIDTRQIKPGDLFIALKGENFDGHDFIPSIIHKVSAIAVSKPLNIDVPSHITIFFVSCTLKFYHNLATQYLKTKSNLTCIAITGSAGKTSTKEWLALLLSSQYKVFKSFGNFNNLIGVPFSALQVKEEEIAIFELGTGKPGDIKQLCNIISPNISAITSIGEAHLEFFGSLDAIAQEKSMVLTMSKKSYIPQSLYNDYTTLFKQADRVDPYTLFDSVQNLNEQGFLLTLNNESFLFPFFGEYNLNNFALAVSIAKDLGVSHSKISHTVFPELPSYRSRIMYKNQTKIILDCYNANPLSMIESIKAIHLFNPKPILILGDMLELGEDTLTFHKTIGETLNHYNFPFIYFYGENMYNAYKAYKGDSTHMLDMEKLKTEIQSYYKKDTPHILFLKASRGVQLELLVQKLQKN